MADPMPPRLNELLSETRWIRALARRLVADPHAAEDLAQDAVLVALDRPPGHGQNLRAWFYRVLQNLVRQHARSTTRRVLRETTRAGVDTGGDPADTADLVARAATQRALVDTVLALEQPFRDTVLLRYFEDLPPRAIAARMAVPVATVNSRLLRAVHQLRQRLDRGADTRDSWRLALVPLPLAISPSVTTFGILFMNTKILAAAALVALGSAAFFFTAPAESPGTAPARHDVANNQPDGATRADGNQTPVAVNERAALTPTTAATPGARANDATRHVHGNLVDADGRRLAAVHVRLADQREATAADGSFSINTQATGATSGKGELIVLVDEDDWQTVLAGSVRAGPTPPATLVVAAPTLRLAGEVRAAGGEAIAATVRVVWPDDLRSRLTDIGDNSNEERVVEPTKDDGTFVLRCGRVRGAVLTVSAEGFVPDRRPLPEHDDGSLRIVLQRPTVKPGMVEGMVVDPGGRPAAGAYVGLAGELMRSDENGRFLLNDDGKDPTLAATLKGHRQAELARGKHGFPPFVVLTLGAEPKTIRGRVVDRAQNGIAGASVWVTDLTTLCDNADVTVEGCAAGASSSDELRARFERGEFAGQTPQQVMRSTPTLAWPRVSCGADGAFELRGLEDRPYRVRAMDPATLLMVELEQVAAGTDNVQLVLDDAQLLPEIAGVAVNHAGTPIANVTVILQIDAQRTGRATSHARGAAETRTDKDGRFTMQRVPRQRAYLRLEGDQILPAEPGRNLEGGLLELGGGRADQLRLVVGQRTHVQVELLDPDSADTIAVLDAEGRTLMLNEISSQRRRESRSLRLSSGRSPVFVVADSAATLVLTKGDAEVRREALTLRADGVNTLRL